MAKRISKAAAIMELLNKGVTNANICRRLNVSPSYVSMLKKQMAHRAEEEPKVEAVQETVGTMERKVPGGPATVVRPDRETSVDAILDERGSNYGTFLGLAQITQRLKGVAHTFAAQHNKTFDADQAEALDLIFTKIGRILNGDPNHVDSWIDIAGYAKLVSDRLEGKSR